MARSFAERVGNRPIHIIGAGSLGSKYAHALCVREVRTIQVWDDDVVEKRNRYNQRFLQKHVGMKKVDAIANYCSELCPDGPTTFILHPERVTRHSALSGIVLSGVDSMNTGRFPLWRCVRKNPNVSFYADGRVGMEAGKAFGLDPNNPEHVYRYEHKPHWHRDPKDIVRGACKTEFPRPEISDLVAAHVIMRLDEWLQLEDGREDPYMNFYGFSFVPVFSDAREYWDEPDEGEASSS